MRNARIYAAGLAASLAMIGSASQAVAGDEITRGELMAITCQACHNAAAAEHGVPDLSPYPPELIASQLRAFRDGDRAATVMDRHATGYTDEEIEAMAAYFGN